MNLSVKQFIRILLLSVAIIPLLLSGVLIGMMESSKRRASILHEQERAADIMADQLLEYVNVDALNQLKASSYYYHFQDLSLDEKRSYISHLLMYNHPKYGKLFNSVALYDCRTGVVECQGLFEKCSEEHIRKRITEQFLSGQCQDELQSGPIQFEAGKGLPTIPIVFPVKDLRSGNTVFNLIASIRLKTAWEKIQASVIGQRNITAFWVDESGYILAHRDPYFVLKKTKIDIPTQKGVFSKGLSGKTSFITSRTLFLNGNIYYLIFERSLTDFFKPLLQNLFNLSAVIAFALLLSLIIARSAARYFLNPIALLTQKVDLLNKGHYTDCIKMNRSDEFGILSAAFDKMANKINAPLNDLLEEIKKRKRLERELAKHRNELEQKILRRTNELSEKTNQLELEAIRRSEINTQLKIKQDEYEDLYETSSIGLVSVSLPDKRVIKCNDAFASITGEKKLSLVGRKVDSLFLESEENTPRIHDLLDNVLSAEELQKLTFRLKGENNRILRMNIVPDFITDKPENVIEIRMSLYDTTERYAVEEELRLHHEIVDKMTEGVYLVRARDGIIVYTHPTFEKMFGYRDNELVGQQVSIVNAGPEDRANTAARKIMQALESKGFWTGEVLNRKKDGSLFWCRAKVSQFTSAQFGEVWMSVHEDITGIKKSENELHRLLNEKDVLLREVHHRVKNNLAVITSLLNLQAEAISDETHKAAFFESRNRIKAMALIHESLYRHEDLSEIRLEGYTKALVDNLLAVYRDVKHRVTIKTQVDNITLSISEGIPCGLILNELISNALKYAFPGDRPGVIHIKASNIKPNDIQLSVQDDGVGMGSEVNVEAPDTLGLKVVSLLATRQLDGSLDTSTDNGVRTVIQWKKGGSDDE